MYRSANVFVNKQLIFYCKCSVLGVLLQLSHLGKQIILLIAGMSNAYILAHMSPLHSFLAAHGLFENLNRL